MKLLLIAAACLVASPAIAQQAPSASLQINQITAVANAIAGQRNDALNQTATCQANVGELQQQLADAQAKIADLEKQIDAKSPHKP